MLSGLPNLAFVIGYTNASWTLKADLVCHHVCRLLNLMDRRAIGAVTPVHAQHGAPPNRAAMPLTSGYVQRATARFPKEGERAPWRMYQNYVRASDPNRLPSFPARGDTHHSPRGARLQLSPGGTFPRVQVLDWLMLKWGRVADPGLLFEPRRAASPTSTAAGASARAAGRPRR